VKEQARTANEELAIELTEYEKTMVRTMELKQKSKSHNKKFLDISNSTSPFFRRTSRD